MNKKLPEHFSVKDTFKEVQSDEVVAFDSFYDAMQEWAITQEKLDYADFAEHEDSKDREEEIEAFKRMTERII